MAKLPPVPPEMQYRTTNDWFGHFAARASVWLGSKWAFCCAVLVIALWAVSGPLFHYSNTWQLVINTGTTIVTFLMVFLIQNTQNRDARAINLKLNELIRAIARARNQMIDIENLSDLELDELQAQYESIRAAYEHRTRNRHKHPKGADVAATQAAVQPSPAAAVAHDEATPDLAPKPDSPEL